MPRKKTPQTSNNPFFITGRISNRSKFHIPIEQVWRIFQEELYMVSKMFDLKIISFVLMNNHFHLLAITEETPIGDALQQLMKQTSIRMNEKSGRINQNWGARAHRTLINNTEYFFNAYRYLYQNPLRAGACKHVEEYPYSTLRGLLGFEHILIPLIEDTTLFDGDLEETLKWLNTLQSPEEVTAIRTGLKYREFKIKSDRYKGGVQLKPDSPPPAK